MRHSISYSFLVAASLILGATAPRLLAQGATAPARVDIVHEKSITELQAAMTSGRLKSVDLVNAYLARISAYDQAGPALNSMIRVNPKARAEAAARDAERLAGKTRGPLHGIPVIIKDNYGTTDLPTTAGSIALADFVPSTEAFQVRKLRDAGAVIIGKSNLHELASGITNVSSMGGQTCNPYDTGRNPGGSSGGSGAAIAASFAAVGFGSDTCGSIRIPAAFNNLFGLRPTKGLSSIDGIIPLSHTQDMAGPLARSVTDLAIALDATIGADRADTATRILDGRPLPQFVSSLDTTALRGARFGVLTSLFGTETDDQEVTRVVRAAIDKMKARGAEFVDIPTPQLDSLALGAAVISYEFKYDLIDYLARTPGSHVRSLSEILERGLYHTALEGQFRNREAQGTRDGAAYLAALKRRGDVRDLVVRYMDEHRLDGLVFPTIKRKPAPVGEVQRGTNCQLSAVTGLPEMNMPAGFTPDGLPVGIAVLGRWLTDSRLMAFAYDYEHATRPRRPPDATPPLVRGRAPLPVAFTLAASRNNVTVNGAFQYDAARRSLVYTVRVVGVTSDRLSAISINVGTSEKPGAMLQRLSGPGVAVTQGSLKLTTAQREDLLAGRLFLTVHTNGRIEGTVRSALLVPFPPPP